MKDEEMADEYVKKEGFRSGMFGELDNITSSEANKELKQTFLAGLKAGRPQWHKVADGDYPDTDRTVLAYSDDVVSGHYPYFAQYYKGFTNAKKNGVDLNWNCWRNNMQRELVEPTVWCEIPTFDKE